jgi:hypothetical protein
MDSKVCNFDLYVDPGVVRIVKPVDHEDDNCEQNQPKSKIQQVNCLAKEEYRLRVKTAKRYLECKCCISSNIDIKIPYFLGVFSKSLPHDELARPNPEAVKIMLKGLNKSIKYLDQIPYSGTLRLVSPSSIYSLDLVGPFKSTISVIPPPSILSTEGAGEMVELYGMALARDIPFSDYNQNPEIQKIINYLNQTRKFKGPKINGKVTPETLFRGNTVGDLKGPFISQFMYLPFKYGSYPIEQKYPPDVPGIDYMTTFATALSVQNGIVLQQAPPPLPKRFIITLRDGSSYIHNDEPPQLFINAMLCILTLKVPYGKGVPPFYNKHEGFFIDYGRVDLWDLLNRTMRVGMMACWYQKYNYMKIRPEAFGIEIDKIKTGKGDIKLSKNIICSGILDETMAKFGSYLLSQAYPEGSPVHPSYVGGHAIIGGCQATILKAFFDENFMIDAFEPSLDGSTLIPLGYKLRLGDELDKLASNMGILRNAAGIHYRSDYTESLVLGEQVAIDMLQDHINRYVRNTTFNFHRFNGQEVTISNTENQC